MPIEILVFNGNRGLFDRSVGLRPHPVLALHISLLFHGVPSRLSRSIIPLFLGDSIENSDPQFKGRVRQHIPRWSILLGIRHWGLPFKKLLGWERETPLEEEECGVEAKNE